MSSSISRVAPLLPAESNSRVAPPFDLFVVGSGSTNTEAARTAIDRLSSVQAQVVGVVLNNAKVSRTSSYGYSYYEAEGAA